MPEWNALASSWAKFHRASTHLDVLGKELDSLGGKPHAFGVETETKAGEAFVRLTAVPEMRDVGLVLGDAVNNYRAALDHLAWDLVKLGTDPRPKRPQDVQYPLAQSWASLAGQRTRRLPGVDDEAFAIVRNHQPYRRDRRGFLLRTLRDISDVDKHRYYVPAAHSMAGFTGRTTFIRCRPIREWHCTPRRTLKVGMKLHRVWFAALGPEPDVQIESQMAVQPCLSRGVPIMPTMLAIRAEVGAILAAFEGWYADG